MLIYIRVKRNAHNPHQSSGNHHATARVDIGDGVAETIPFYVLKMTDYQLNGNQEKIKRYG